MDIVPRPAPQPTNGPAPSARPDDDAPDDISNSTSDAMAGTTADPRTGHSGNLGDDLSGKLGRNTGGDLSSEVIDAFVSLADTLTTDYDPADLLPHLLERTMHLLGLSAAGILLADPTGKLHVAAASSSDMKDLEVFQLSLQDGPCLQCYATGAPVHALAPGDAEEHWPTFATGMRALGLASVVAVPLRLREQTLGALGMFSRSWNTPHPGAVRTAQGLADIATIALLQDRTAHSARTLSAQLQAALDSRVLIEQAKGVIATQRGCTIEEAFQLLRSTARRRGTKLVVMAQAVVQGRMTASELSR